MLCLTRSVHALQLGGDHHELWDSDDSDPGAQPQHMLIANGYVITFGPADNSTSTITAFRASDGAFLWKRTVTGTIDSQAIVAGKIVVTVIGPADTRLRSFTLNDTGTVGWNLVIQKDLGGLVGADAQIALRQGGRSSSVHRTPAPSSDRGLRRSCSSVRSPATPIGCTSRRPSSATSETRPMRVSRRCASATRHNGGTSTPQIRSGPDLPSAAASWVHASDLVRFRFPSELLAVDAVTGAVLHEFAPNDTSSTPPILGDGRLMITTPQRVDVMGVMAPAVSVPVLPLPTAWVANDYAGAVTAVGGSAPITWSIVGGAPPPGVSLSPAGELSGVPTTPGTYDFVARAFDQRGRSATQTLTIAVRAPVADNWATGRHSASRNPVAGTSMITADMLSTFSVRWDSDPHGAGNLDPGHFAEEPVIVGSWLFGSETTATCSAFDLSTDGQHKVPTWTLPGPIDDTFDGTPTVVGSPTTGASMCSGLTTSTRSTLPLTRSTGRTTSPTATIARRANGRGEPRTS